MRWPVATATVLIDTCTPPAPRRARIPASPKVTASSAASSPTMVNTTPPGGVAAAGVAATVAPAAARFFVRSAVRL